MKSETPKLQLSEMAQQILRKRILRRDQTGTPLETPDQMFSRVAWQIAKSEHKYVAETQVREVAESFYRMLTSFDFLPNSPTLINAGLPGGQLSACFVLPIEDSMESIFGTLRDMALIQKTGGGTGFSFSRLRPRNDFISSTGGWSSGPVSFMRLFDFACETTRLGGARSGANMGVMRFDHPDILEFIHAKSRGDTLRTFNISVAVSDFFMESVRRLADYPLVNPRTGQQSGRLNAQLVFDAIAEAAWETGDPGLVFLDAINRGNPTPALGKIEATNPCGEQPLLPYESCNLGSINVSRFVREAKVDFDRLRPVVHRAVRFLDDVIDTNQYPLPAIQERTLATRKVGLGIMGFADMLLMLGLPYDCEDAVETAEGLMKFISEEARAESCRLAEERGVFPSYDLSVFAEKKIRPRNAAVTTVAPTGTISLIAGCSSGIEPLFAIAYVCRMLGEEREFSTHPLFEKLAAAYLSKNVRHAISETGSVQTVKEIPEELRRLFVTAHDIAPEWHVRMQAAFQRHVDSAVSKTVNLRRAATPEDIAKVYLLAHGQGCKGITVFRDACRATQVLTAGKPARVMPAGTEACPECGGPMEHGSACVTCVSCGYTYCTI